MVSDGSKSEGISKRGPERSTDITFVSETDTVTNVSRTPGKTTAKEASRKSPRRPPKGKKTTGGSSSSTTKTPGKNQKAGGNKKRKVAFTEEVTSGTDAADNTNTTEQERRPAKKKAREGKMARPKKPALTVDTSRRKEVTLHRALKLPDHEALRAGVEGRNWGRITYVRDNMAELAEACALNAGEFSMDFSKGAFRFLQSDPVFYEMTCVMVGVNRLGTHEERGVSQELLVAPLPSLMSVFPNDWTLDRVDNELQKDMPWIRTNTEDADGPENGRAHRAYTRMRENFRLFRENVGHLERRMMLEARDENRRRKDEVSQQTRTEFRHLTTNFTRLHNYVSDVVMALPITNDIRVRPTSHVVQRGEWGIAFDKARDISEVYDDMGPYSRLVRPQLDRRTGNMEDTFLDAIGTSGKPVKVSRLLLDRKGGEREGVGRNAATRLFPGKVVRLVMSVRGPYTWQTTEQHLQSDGSALEGKRARLMVCVEAIDACSPYKNVAFSCPTMRWKDKTDCYRVPMKSHYFTMRNPHERFISPQDVRTWLWNRYLVECSLVA